MATREYRWRHLALLISILLLFAVTPLAVTFRHGLLILDIAAATILVAASYALSEQKHLFTIAVVLSVISIIAAGLLLVFPQRWAVLEHGCVVVLVSFFVIQYSRLCLAHRQGHGRQNLCCGCVYMLIGFAWTFAYAFLEEMVPGSFVALSETGRNDYVARVLRLRYFSFITLTTVGYGDIIPRSQAARTMAIIEAVMGQIYLMVLVARLVGLHIVHSHVSERRDKD